MNVSTEHPKTMRRFPWGIVSIFIIVVALGIWAYVATRPHPAVVTQRDILAQISLNGEVIAPPSARADVMPPYRAPVDKVRTSVGKQVDRGDVIVELSMPSVEAVTDQARANLKTAESAYADARRRYDRSISTAKKQLDSAEANAANNPPPPDQNSPAPVPIPPDAGVAEAKQALSAARSERDTALSPYLQQVEGAREAYRQARSGAKIAQIRAPIKGTVLALNAQPGREVGVDSKTPVAVIVNLRALQVQANLTADQVPAAKTGTLVALRFKEIPTELTGKIIRVTTQVVSRLGGIRKDQQYVAIIDFKNENGVAKPGMKPIAGIILGAVRKALAVPNDAVHLDSTGKPTVNVLRGGAWQAATVETGISDGQYTQIKSGLQNGETVQVTPSLLRSASHSRG